MRLQQITTSALAADVESVLARVARGETLEITISGTAVARIVPASMPTRIAEPVQTESAHRTSADAITVDLGILDHESW